MQGIKYAEHLPHSTLWCCSQGLCGCWQPWCFAVIFDLSIILQGRGTGVGAAWSSTVPVAVIQLLPPAVHFEQKEKIRKEKWKPEQSTKISYISSRDLHNFPFFFAPYIPPPASRHCLFLAFKCLANKLAALFPFSWIFSHFHIPFFWFLARLHFRLLCQRGVWLMPATPLGNAFNKWHQKLKLATGV